MRISLFLIRGTYKVKTFAAAVIQFRGSGEPDEDLAQFERMVREAASGGASLICGPEYVYFSGDTRALEELATPVPGPISDRFSALARECSVYLCPGTIPEYNSRGKPYNTLLFFSPGGALLGKYRKRHLFRAEIAGLGRVDESEHLSAGKDPAPMLDTEIGRIGVSICYDLRFPEQFLRLAICGAEIIVLPAAVTEPTGRAHWHLLCRARAVETGCFLLAPNRTGTCGGDIERYGHSLIVDPWGMVIAEAGGTDGIISATLRPELLSDVRSRLSSIEDRVPGDSLYDLE